MFADQPELEAEPCLNNRTNRHNFAAANINKTIITTVKNTYRYSPLIMKSPTRNMHTANTTAASKTKESIRTSKYFLILSVLTNTILPVH